MPVARALELEPTWPVVEAKIGRRLSQAEKAIDILKLNHALNDAKDRVERAIRIEMLRVARKYVRDGLPMMMRLQLTMLRPLDELYQLGRTEAAAELERLGYTGVKRAYEADPTHPNSRMERLAKKIKRALPGLAVTVEKGMVSAEFSNPAALAIATAIMTMPGARAIAADVVSTALAAGLETTFEANADLIPAWEYTAVLDGGTCDECAPLDGQTFESLDDLFAVLPGFGPNPSCRGGDRCRCRAVPAAAALAEAA